MTSKTLRLAILVLAVTLGHFGRDVKMVSCQMALPFSGQGKDPSEPVDVYVSAMMERLLDGRFDYGVPLFNSCDDAR
jgi:hypothetical protein